MKPDPIIEELHRIREEYAARFNYDMEAIGRDLQAKEARDGRRLVSFPPKRPKCWVEPIPEQRAS